MKDAFDAKDGKTVEQFAHKLKGGSMNIGATKLSRLFERVEETARKDVGEISPSLLAKIDREFDVTTSCLRAYAASS